MMTIGDVMAESMTAPLKQKIPVSVIPIAVNTDYLKPIAKQDNPFAKQYGLTDKFVVLYSGKMGMGHNIEMILDAAELLQDNSNIQFVFIGSGSKYNVVEQFIAKHRSQNILLLPMQSDDVFPYSMACGDVGIVTQETSMAHLFMPSKTYSMMACGLVILGIGTNHDDLYHLIQKEKIGVSFTEGNAEKLAEQITLLSDDGAKMSEYRKNARDVAERSFSLGAIKEAYSVFFEEVMGVI
jgi:glycosyltransferase involved in cell wall biosynthesis